MISGHRWSFDLAVAPRGGGHVTRSAAWDRCRAAGLLVDIPAHAWRARHRSNRWCWVSVTPAEVDAHDQRYAAWRARHVDPIDHRDPPRLPRTWWWRRRRR